MVTIKIRLPAFSAFFACRPAGSGYYVNQFHYWAMGPFMAWTFVLIRFRHWAMWSRWRFLGAALLAPGLALSQPFTNSAIFLENQKPGTPNWLLTNPSPDVSTNGGIEGYASLTSVNRGGQINLLVNTTDSAYILEVYRIGWYGGAGARRVLGPITVAGTAQAIPPISPLTGLVECNWTNPYVLN